MKKEKKRKKGLRLHVAQLLLLSHPSSISFPDFRIFWIAPENWRRTSFGSTKSRAIVSPRYVIYSEKAFSCIHRLWDNLMPYINSRMFLLKCHSSPMRGNHRLWKLKVKRNIRKLNLFVVLKHQILSHTQTILILYTPALFKSWLCDSLVRNYGRGWGDA